MPSLAADPASDAALDEVELLNMAFRYAMALVHHRQDAEDLAQEAWLNLCRRYGRIPSRAVLFTTVKNLVVDRYRRAQVISFETGEELDETTAPTGDQPGTSTDVEELLGSLREGEREALFLHYIEGHTAEEIGRLTSQPRNTVLSLMRRGMQKLRGIVARDPSTAAPPD